MDYVTDILFRDRDGEEHHADDLDNYGQMQEVTVTFSCPICDNDNSVTQAHPMDEDTEFTCPSCEEQYYVLPVVAPKNGKALLDMTIGEKVDYQMRSIADFYRVEDRYPGDAAEVTESLQTIAFAFAGISLAYLGVAIQLTQPAARELVLSNLVFAIGLAIPLVAGALGFVAVYVGHLGALLRVRKLYKKSGADYSFGEFLRRAGNYYHRNPLLRG